MENEFFGRRQTWRAPPRPEWVQRLNEEGEKLDIKGIVPLDPTSLISTAIENSGLSDFGDNDWYEPFALLARCFDSEAKLNLLGRICTRSDILLFLEARLSIQEAFRLHPEIAEQKIVKPMMIIGQGRSGTSILHNVLSHDPNNRVIRTWEILYPYFSSDLDPISINLKKQRADKIVSQINHIIPDIVSMHEFYGDVPADCAMAHCLTFNSPAWFVPMQGQVPSYAREMAKRSAIPVYQFEKKLLQLLQWQHPRKHWVLKSPFSINHIPEILQVFPDMGFIWPHRDPVKSLSSMVNLLGMTFWARSNHPFIGNSMDLYTNADIGASMLSRPIDWLEDGSLPAQRLFGFQYSDFIENPISTIQAMYCHFDLELTDVARDSMIKYLSEHQRPAHRYDTGPSDLIWNERRAYKRYQDYFSVKNEF